MKIVSREGDIVSGSQNSKSRCEERFNQYQRKRRRGCESIYNSTKEVGAVLFSRCGSNELLTSHFVLCEEQIVLEVTKEQTTYRCVVDILIVKVIRPIQMPSSSEGR